MTKELGPEADQPALLGEQMQGAIESLRLPEGHAVIIGGAALQLHGIRQTYDIDILISPGLYDFIDTYRVFGREQSGYEKWSHGFYRPTNVSRLPFDPKYTGLNGRLRLKAYLTAGFNDDIYPLSFDEALGNVEVTRGLPVLSLNIVRAWKHAVGRPKDIADIELIDDHLSQ